jgi:hypothetical protein
MKYMNAVECPYNNVLTCKVFHYLTFTLNDPKSKISVKLPSFKIFLTLQPDTLLL